MARRHAKIIKVQSMTKVGTFFYPFIIRRIDINLCAISHLCRFIIDIIYYYSNGQEACTNNVNSIALNPTPGFPNEFSWYVQLSTFFS